MPDYIPTSQRQRDHLRRWVEALRSGEYKQGTGRLRSGDEYCCLGVACDVYRLTTKKGRWFDREAFTIGTHGLVGTDLWNERGTAAKVRRFFGLMEANGEGLMTDLINYNDGTGEAGKKTFRGIATVIEKRFGLKELP